MVWGASTKTDSGTSSSSTDTDQPSRHARARAFGGATMATKLGHKCEVPSERVHLPAPWAVWGASSGINRGMCSFSIDTNRPSRHAACAGDRRAAASSDGGARGRRDRVPSQQLGYILKLTHRGAAPVRRRRLPCLYARRRFCTTTRAAGGCVDRWRSPRTCSWKRWSSTS